MDHKMDSLPFMTPCSHDILLSIVVPAFNEEEVLPTFHNRVCNVLKSMPITAEVVYVNDGSTDNTLAVMQVLREKDRRIAIVDLSRNFGKEIALSAGLDHAKGEAVVVIDADLQDPPELIPVLVENWMNGYDVVCAKRIVRDGESALKKATAHAFYRLMSKLGKVKLPEDVGDFRLLSRRAIDSLKQMREHHRFMKGLFAWIGYPTKVVTYSRDPRYAGQTKWSYWQLWNFALEGITSFTIVPLRVASYIGILTAVMAFVYAVFVLCKTFLYGDPARGYPSLMIVVLMLGGTQLITIGVIGEYIGRIFNESKNRPLYFLKGYMPSKFGERKQTSP